MTTPDIAEARRLADAIDPFARKVAPDHLTSKVAADQLRALSDELERLREQSEAGWAEVKRLAGERDRLTVEAERLRAQVATAAEVLAALDFCDEGCTNGGLGPGWYNGNGEEAGTRLQAARAALKASLAASPAAPAQQADHAALLRMLAQRARAFPAYPLGYHIPEVFAALGEAPPQPAEAQGFGSGVSAQAPGLAATAQQDEPKASFADSRVQRVYDILCADEMPPKEQHWEGWVARRIVDALAPSLTVEGEPVAYAVWWGLGFMRKHSVHFELATAKDVAANIKSYTEIRPLYANPQATTGGDERRHVICLCPDCTKPAAQAEPVTFGQAVQSGLTRSELRRAQVEPVAWMFQHDETGRCCFCANDGVNTVASFTVANPSLRYVCALYTAHAPAQPAAQGVELTDERILHLQETHVGGPSPSYPLDNNDWINFARAVIAADLAALAQAQKEQP